MDNYTLPTFGLSGFTLPTCGLKNNTLPLMVWDYSFCLPVVSKVTNYLLVIWDGFILPTCGFQKLDKMSQIL